MTDFLLVYGYAAVVLTVVFGVGKTLDAMSQTMQWQLSPQLFRRGIPLLLALALLSPAWMLETSSAPLTIVSGQAFESSVTSVNATSPSASSLLEPLPEFEMTSLAMVLGEALGAVVLGWMALWTLFYLWRLFVTLRYVKRCLVLRQVGNLRIALTQDATPFAFRILSRAHILLPEAMIAKTEDLAIALRHEAQHHRHGDTFWVHVQELLLGWFFWNPVVRVGISHWRDVQEWACDESLIGRQRVSVASYTRCLVEVAESALIPAVPLAGTTSMATGVCAQKLKRRILSMEGYLDTRKRKSAVLAAALAVTVVASSGWAAQELVFDRQLNEVELQDLVKADSDFPVEVNEPIAEQVMRYVGTPEGRDFIAKAMERREAHNAMFLEKLRSYGLPEELLAVALMESGYANPPQRPTGSLSAGIWQFIPQTARSFGLRVDQSADERLDATLATDAALRYLNALYLRFKDWRLAIMAYNAGEGRVQRGIEATGSRDPWTLVAAGYEGDKTYLAKVMAGVLILDNLELVAER